MRKFVIAAGLALAGVACSGGSGHGGSDDQSNDSSSPSATATPVQLYSWWVAPGEAQALQALINTYEGAYAGGQVNDSGNKSGADTRANLDTAFSASTFPDVFQLNFQDLPGFMADHPNQVAAVDEFFSDPATKAAFLPDVLEQVTINGHIQAIPIDVPRESAFFYNASIFAAQNIAPPQSVGDLMTACAALKSAGITPIALATGSGNGWIVRELFNGILQGTMGAAVFNDFITAAKPISDPEITPPLQSAIHTLGQIITNYINADAGSANFGWTNAADEVQAGQAAVYIHGDWVKGYWTALGWQPGVDFGETGAPGAADVFSYGIDVLGTPTMPPDPAAASDFMTVVASASGQVAFSNSKGSSPARTDVGDQLDVLGKATLNDLVNATVRLPVYAPEAWDTALGVFSASSCQAADEATLYGAYVANPPVAAVAGDP